MSLRAWIYDRALRPLTKGWYGEVFARLEPGARLLDVGIGTGGSLCANANAVRERDLHIVGVDIDPDYVRQARRHVQRAGLSDRVTVHLESIYDFDQVGFDAAYFSASFMLMPDPEGALKHVLGLLEPHGVVFFTQTFQERRSLLAEKVKPMLRSLTTVDFGDVTYEEDFLEMVEGVGLKVTTNETLGRRSNMCFRLVAGEYEGSAAYSSPAR